MKRIKVFDTTLRDGEQSPGCSMTSRKSWTWHGSWTLWAWMIIEAGFAIVSPEDSKSVEAIAKTVPKLRRGQPGPLCQGRYRRRLERLEGGEASPHPTSSSQPVKSTWNISCG